MTLCITEDKRRRALSLISWALDKKKLTVKQAQSITGTLIFLCRAIVPGRTFTRRMYSKITGIIDNNSALKHFHHISLDAEFISDCQMWQLFLTHADTQKVLCRPFTDVCGLAATSEILQFFTNASTGNKFGLNGGFGCFFNGRWNFGIWPQNFMLQESPSIDYLELYALCVGVLTWSKLLTHRNVTIFCDNTGVRDMVNSTVGKNNQSMVLLRILMLECLIHNICLSVEYLSTYKNILADALSRQDFETFWRNAPEHTSSEPDPLPAVLSPIEKVWCKFKN